MLLKGPSWAIASIIWRTYNWYCTSSSVRSGGSFFHEI